MHETDAPVTEVHMQCNAPYISLGTFQRQLTDVDIDGKRLVRLRSACVWAVAVFFSPSFMEIDRIG